MSSRQAWQAGVLVVFLCAGLTGCERRAAEEQRVGNATQPAGAPANAARSDTDITTAVQAHYYRDDLVRGRQIDVNTQNGVVTLEGTVRTEEVKQRAVNIAQGVEGVAQVNDQLVVRQDTADAGAGAPGPRADGGGESPTGTAGSAAGGVEAGWITTKVHAQYFASPDVSPFNIDVTTSSGGVVTLAGEVENAQQRAAAVRIARETEGVTRVIDQLRIRGEQKAAADPAGTGTELERPDAWLTTKVQAKYFLDGDVKGRNIDVETHEGVVTLSGTVGSEAERRQAVALARNTDGVRSVTDRLSVQANATAGDRDEPIRPVPSLDRAATDTRITTAIQSKYFLDDQLKGHRIDVDTRQGVVTLTGQVTSTTLKEEAERIAQETEAVSKVVNRITVSGS